MGQGRAAQGGSRSRRPTPQALALETAAVAAGVAGGLQLPAGAGAAVHRPAGIHGHAVALWRGAGRGRLVLSPALPVARPGPDGAEPADLAGGGRRPALPVHNGFDLQAIEKARDHNAKGGRLRGASTISQQVAKNLFLWQGRSWIRKGLEVWYTVLIEALWPKERISRCTPTLLSSAMVYMARRQRHRHSGARMRRG